MNKVVQMLLNISYFNSIKVQLEQKIRRVKEAIEKFQFHKGTIRTLCQFPYDGSRATFQFHKGTIRTR